MSWFAPGAVAVGVSWGLYFLLYERIKYGYRVAAGHDLSKPSTLTFWHHVGAGLQASAVTALVTSPLFLVKTRLQLQLQHSPANYTGMVHAVKSIVRSDGVGGLYRGIVPALLLTSHGAIQFSAYEKMKQLSWARGVSLVRMH
jgi:solute carrier family 25 folate transporter 32